MINSKAHLQKVSALFCAKWMKRIKKFAQFNKK